MPAQQSTDSEDGRDSYNAVDDDDLSINDNASLMNQGDIETEQDDRPPDNNSEEEPLDETRSKNGDGHIVSSASSSLDPPPPLSESSRLKGYIRLGFLSCLAFVSAFESDLEHCVQYSSSGLDGSSLVHNNSNISNNSQLIIQSPPLTNETIVCKQWNFGPRQELNPVPSSPSSRAYAMVVGGMSAVLNIFIVGVHMLDGSVCVVKRAREYFRPGSSVECTVLVFLGLCKLMYDGFIPNRVPTQLFLFLFLACSYI